mmetsp:Transcript_30169/g.72412  ORF Transcript_30169/g.72412 Transcript_30169/m.72412 type:complete len:107 (+) Transcript_30169:1454-1774(+)
MRPCNNGMEALSFPIVSTLLEFYHFSMRRMGQLLGSATKKIKEETAKVLWDLQSKCPPVLEVACILLTRQWAMMKWPKLENGSICLYFCNNKDVSFARIDSTEVRP